MSSASTSSATATPKATTISSLTPHTSSSFKRKMQVFIELPDSPFRSPASYESSRNNKSNDVRSRPSLLGRKAGTPLSAKALNNNNSAVAAHPTDSQPPLKKTKMTVQEDKSVKKPNKAEKGENSAEDFPNGYYYCHQCNQKRDNSSGLQCTLMKESERCSKKYCKPCMKNRYGQIAEEVTSRGRPSKADIRSGHMPSVDYVWKCPKCADTCNCHKCRKGKGLGPTGKFDSTEVLTAANSIENSQKASHRTIKRGVAETNTSKKSTMPSTNRSESASTVSKVQPSKKLDVHGIPSAKADAKPAEKPKQKSGRRKRDVPEPKWTKVPTELDRPQAEDRFLLREFLLRFAPLMSISGKHLEDLDEFDILSDAGLKSIILNLLSFISADSEPSVQKIIRDCHKQISGGGFNPSSMWTTLSQLHEKLPSSSNLRIPEPLPPVAGTHRTRTAHFVTQASQLLPILNALVECAMVSVSAREEIEAGAQDAKEENRKYYAAVKEENDRWGVEREKLLTEREGAEKAAGWDAKKAAQAYRDAYKKHKATIFELDNAHAFKLQAYAPRFKALGTDAEGRTYYASTSYKGKAVPTKEERSSMKKWGWFLAVWGKVEKPMKKGKGAETHLQDVDEDMYDSSNEEDSEGWWGFSDPLQIKNLAKWIAAKEELDIKRQSDGDNKDPKRVTNNSDARRSASTFAKAVSSIADRATAKKISSPWEADSVDEMDIDGSGDRNTQAQRDLRGVGRKPTRDELKVLVRNLNDYGDFLAWRCGENLALTDPDEDEAEKGNRRKKMGQGKAS